MFFIKFSQIIKIKFLFTIIIIFTFNHNYSQDISTLKNMARFSSQEDIQIYINKAKKDGINLSQALQFVTAQGANPQEIELLSRLWNSNTNKSTNIEQVNNPLQINGKLTQVEENLVNSSKANRFGSYFFNNNNLSETPNLYLATPADYRLGPGDELLINIYGSLEYTYTTEISREGNVKFDGIAPVYLSGLSIINAKKRLKSRLSKIYSGLLSEDKVDKVDIDVSLLKARSITVNIVGNISAPGTYTISGFSSILNALYSAGGPNNVGTYRKIQVIRSGNSIKEIDLYEYFSKGLYPNVYLRDQDVIFVPNIKKEILLSDGFKINSRFELLNDETYSDVLNLAGGFNSNSYKQKIFIKSNDGLNKDFNEIDVINLENFIPKDGDVVTARIPNDFIENKVDVRGSVLIPGFYNLNKTPTIRELIKSAKGFTRDAATKNASLFRYKDGVLDEVINLNLENQEDLDIELKVLDLLQVFSKDDLKVTEQIEVIGEVKNPKKINFSKNLTLSDAISSVGGFTSRSDLSTIEIYKNVTSNNSIEKTEILEISVDENFKSTAPVYLSPNDIIVVKIKEFERELDKYYAYGEVAIEGVRLIEKADYTTSDFINDNKFSKEADIYNSYIIRNNLSSPIFKKNKEIYDLKIKPNDEIFFPKKSSEVTITGNVNNELILPYGKNLNFRKYLAKAGGVKVNTDLRRSYVISKNKVSKPVRTFLWFKFFPKISSGDIIIIKNKEVKEKASISEILGISSTLASLVALIKIISD